MKHVCAAGSCAVSATRCTEKHCGAANNKEKEEKEEKEEEEEKPEERKSQRGCGVEYKRNDSGVSQYIDHRS